MTADYAVMQTRKSAVDNLDFFPTPPWATRALLEWMDTNGIEINSKRAWEPAAGGRHMSRVLEERFWHVYASDVHDYGGLDFVGSFIGEGADVASTPVGGVDWIITNPPFNLAEVFFARAIHDAQCGVALLLRSAWMEGSGRWERVFRETPPSYVLQFAERVPMIKGRWDPTASTATAYAWFVWLLPLGRSTSLGWIVPGASKRCSRPSDVETFAGERARA